MSGTGGTPLCNYARKFDKKTKDWERSEEKQTNSGIYACRECRPPRPEQAFFENQLLNYKQTAQYLSLSEPYLRRLKAQGELPYVIVGGRAVRFRVSSLDKWIEEREIK